MDSIDKYVRSLQKSPQDRAGAIHPSSLGKCGRAAIYEYLGFEPDREWSDRELRVFAMGYLVEDFVANSHEHTDELIARNIPLVGEYRGVKVEGEADLLLRVDGGWCIADVKSVHSNSFGYSSFPYEHHCYQVGAYEWLLGGLLTTSFNAAEHRIAMINGALRSGEYGPQRDSRIIYVSKDDLRVETVTIGEGAKEMALTEIAKLVGYIKAKAIPDRPFQSPEEHRWLCARCIRKGYQKKDGTYSEGKEPLYEPKCKFFERCWGVMPSQWNFWEEVVGYEAP